MAPNPNDQKWHAIADRASKETDPDKLMGLIDELCEALDERVKHREKESNSSSATAKN